MIKELKTYRVGQYDRERFINSKIKSLEDEGWTVLSHAHQDENHVSFLVSKPEVQVSFVAETTENLKKVEEYFEANKERILGGLPMIVTEEESKLLDSIRIDRV